MDSFSEDQFEPDMFWLEESLQMNQSAFLGYAEKPIENLSSKNFFVGSNSDSMNMKMVNSVGDNGIKQSEAMEPEKDRSHQPMINERMRREREKQNYNALHSLLPPKTKDDKNSIVTVAIKEVQEMQSQKKELEKRNEELMRNLVEEEDEKIEVAKIRVTVNKPSSGIDSMLGVFHCLKNLGIKIRSIQSNFSYEQLSAILEIETKLPAEEVEKEVERTLIDVEKKLLFQFPGCYL
ncbi:Myc-type, basic helix-loop-helix (bHLH) domain [Dillenia turbinata]|uniref:Myc-type, basic helix-loop-helix (BHLH) domain n=1 Tax=Dillenia turbinata TaxID=194707 RepID=A0AAN8UP76_9MAGN